MSHVPDQDELARWVERGHRLSQQRYVVEAEACYRRALAIAPDHPMVHNNLGWTREQRGDARGAIAEYEHALQLDGSLGLARANLSNLLVRLGWRDQALSLWRAAADRDSGLLTELETLINHAMNMGDLAAAAEHAAISAALRMGTRWYPARADLSPVQERLAPKRTLTLGKLRHDADQFLYLQRRGILGRGLTEIIAKYERLIERLARMGGDPRVPLDGADLKEVGGVYGRLAHVRETPRISSSVFGSWSSHVVENEYLAHAPGVVVVDNFLSDEALHALYEFCLESTVWCTNRYIHNRLGAFFRDGFNCPLLIQIAMALRERLPNVIGPRYPLRQMWGFKYDRSLPSNPLHADFAAVNVNFWLTPDEANLDQGRSGLVVYDLEAPLDWDFETYNRRGDKIEQFLRTNGARAIAIPYRQNRAVIFNSDLFHATAPMNFRGDYENRRVNVTMLYGDRVNARHRVQG